MGDLKEKIRGERSANEIFCAGKWRRREFSSSRVGHKTGKEIAPFGEILSTTRAFFFYHKRQGGVVEKPYW